MNPLDNLKTMVAGMPNPVELAKTARTTQQVMQKQLEQIIRQTQLMEVWADTNVRIAVALEKIEKKIK